MTLNYCITSDNNDEFFVGVRFQNGTPQVVFPHGYDLPDDEKECRKDVFRLLAVLRRFSEHREGERTESFDNECASFPIESYQYVIQDFLANGYYVENEIRYSESIRGKVNWKKTVQKEKVQFDGKNAIYLKFQVKTNHTKENDMITKVHQYCVYHCFLRFGWLFFSSNYLPIEPTVKFNKELFLSVLHSALSKTFNDAKKRLFQSMINIVLNIEENADIKSFSIGVNKFEKVWEDLIDFVFGEKNKDEYFPHATWHIIRDGKVDQSSALEPDTIMKHDGKIYVLDAKYYRYGITGYEGHLPQTSSIQKQITYGKHIAEQKCEVPKENVYNAFIMPFNAGDGIKYKFVSVGTADWEKYNKDTMNYAYVLGILIDTKWLISEYTKHNATEIENLAGLIEKSLSDFRKHNPEL